MAAYPDLRIAFAVGSTYEDLLSVHLSYSEACELTERSDLYDENDIMWFSDVHRSRTTFYYPLNLEVRLINLVKAGMAEQSAEIFDHIVSRNIGERALSREMKKQFYHELLGTYLRIAEQIDEGAIPNQGDEINPAETPIRIESYEEFGTLKKHFLHVCNYIHDSRRSHGEKRRREIAEHINGYSGENCRAFRRKAATF